MKHISFTLLLVMLMSMASNKALAYDNIKPSYILNKQWVSCSNSCKLLDPYYSDGVTFEWTGGCKNGKAHGIGKAIKFNNGQYESTYEGEYKDGIREGHGKFSHTDGSVKEGIFIKGQLIGKGKMTDNDGNSYEGNFINYRAHGIGKYKMANGSIFEGWFVADKPYTGKLTNYDGNITYLQEGVPVEKIVETKSDYKPKIGVRVTEYFDKNWNRCQAKNAAYYRLITYKAPNKPTGKIKDYYITGELQGDFTAIYIDYSDEGKNFFEGEANWYYKSGKLEKKCYFYNSKLNGPETSYYENGIVQSSANYSHGVLNGSAISNYPNGNPRIIANYDNGILKNNKYLQFTEERIAFLVYNENFIKNRESWEYNGVNGELSVNSDNTISLQVTPNRTVSGGIYTSFSATGENIISIKTHRQAKNENIIGLLFGFKDWDNYCGLYISGSEYVFQYIKNGRQMTRQEWKTSAAIESEVNTLTIVNSGNKTSLIINDVTIEEYSRIIYDGAFCCITGVNNSNDICRFDAANLTVSELVDLNNISGDYLPQQESQEGWTSSGSGFFISENGYVATNYHVVEDAKVIEVSIMRDGDWKHYPAKVIL